MAEKYTSVHYHSYLQLDKLLGAQHPRSNDLGEPAHDEVLFIILHQVYELWFKQIIHELTSVMQMFEDDLVDEREIMIAVHRLHRIIEIQKLLIQQINVMETMTPLDFLEFRNYLFPASGFQSFQFRQVEVALGLRSKERITYNNAPFDTVFDEEKRDTLKSAEERRSLLELVNDWLERTPFLDLDGFNFIEAYQQALRDMIEKERSAINASDILTDENKHARLKMLDKTESYFDSVLNPEAHRQLFEEGKVKLTYKATIGALFINVYRDQPILQMPYQFLEAMLDIEENFTTWRYRHAQMVLRMIGQKTGTGGSSGHSYLRETAVKHQVFNDLYNISTLLIPRSEQPVLPEHLRRKLGFYFTASNKD